MLKKVLSNTFLYGIAPQLVALINILLLPLITPFLTAEDYGVYGIVMAVISGLSVLQFLGLDIVIANAFFKNKRTYIEIWRKVLGVLILWHLPFQVLQIIILKLLIPSSAQTVEWEIIILSIISSLFASTLSFFGTIYCYLNSKAKAIFYRVFISGVFVALVNYYLIVYENYGFMGWFYGNTLGAVLLGVSFVPLFIQLNLYPVFTLKIKKLLKVGVSSLPHHYATFFLESSDRLLLDFMKIPLTQIGRYNLGNSIGSKIFQMSKGISLATEPLIIKMYQNAKLNKAQKMIDKISLLFLLGTIFICIWTKEIFELLIRSEGLEGVYPLAIIIIMAMNFRPYYVLFNVILEYKEKTYLLSSISLLIALCNIIVNILLIPYYGIYGAAISTFVCYLLLGFSPVLLKTFREENVKISNIIFWFFAIIISLLVVFQLKDIEVLYKVGVSVLLLIGLLFSWRNNSLKQVEI